MGVKVTYGSVEVGRFVDDTITLPCTLNYMGNDLVVEHTAPTQGLDYTMANNWEYCTCSGASGIGTKTDIEIAEKKNGAPVTILGASVFANNSYIKTLVLPNSITEIGNNACFFATNLTTVYLGKNNKLATIRANAFMTCLSLKKIVFNRTKAEWDKVTKESGWNTNNTSVGIVCSDGTFYYTGG